MSCFEQSADDAIDRGGLSNAFRELALANPSDLEAKAFFVRQRVLDARKNRGGGQQRSGVLGKLLTADEIAETDGWIRQVLRNDIRHPIHAYRALLWQEDDLERAVRHAEMATLAASKNPHIWSLAGQLRARLGRPEEAISALERAVLLFAAHMREERLLPDEVAGLATAQDLLCQQLASTGRIDAAISLAKEMVDAPGAEESYRLFATKRLSAVVADAGPHGSKSGEDVSLLNLQGLGTSSYRSRDWNFC
jgi:tetratricopeptide (TPR) repeat protein